jgi:hypothetical protein
MKEGPHAWAIPSHVEQAHAAAREAAPIARPQPIKYFSLLCFFLLFFLHLLFTLLIDRPWSFNFTKDVHCIKNKMLTYFTLNVYISWEETNVA